jgi:hypothetical protein
VSREFASAGACMRTRAVVAGTALVLSACAGGAIAPSPPAPVPEAAPSEAPSVAVVARVSLPARLPSTTWRVQSLARVKVTGGGVTGAAGDEQRVESNALVSWSMERQPSGAVRATGQVDSFTVHTSFDRQRGSFLPSTPAMVLLEATLDSALVRVSTRPPLANECDRPEAGAASLARELLLRVPDGARPGDRWKDSSVVLICRSGVPMTVYSTVESRLHQVTAERLVIRREISSRFEGRGGSAFRSLELAGTSSGVQTVHIEPQRGTVDRLAGTSTLTLQATERTPGNAARVQQVTQRTELTAIRAR